MSTTLINQHVHNMNGMDLELVAKLATLYGLTGEELDLQVQMQLTSPQRDTLARYGYVTYVDPADPPSVLPRRVRSSACLAQLVAVALTAPSYIAAQERRHVPQTLIAS